jgi:type II secretory pathway pseudopilin PulG
MRLFPLAALAVGYVLGAKAGRVRYDQLRAAARDAREAFDAAGTRERLEAYSARLEAYADSRAHRPPAA